MKKVDLILTADWHLRDSTPDCRTDDFYAAQWRKVDEIAALQNQYDCPVIHSGDLFDYWKPSLPLVRDTILHLPKQFHTIFGNHDLPQHNLTLWKKCGIGVLEAAGALSILKGTHWGQEPRRRKALQVGGRIILVWHLMTYQGKSPYPGVQNPARSIIRKYSEFDLILTGHNHTPFVEELSGRLLVNPGAITRQEADKARDKPRIYLYHVKENKVTPIYLSIENGVVQASDKVLEKKEKEQRMMTFIDKLTGDGITGLDYEKNVHRYLETNEVSSSVKDIILKSLDYGN